MGFIRLIFRLNWLFWGFFGFNLQLVGSVGYFFGFSFLSWRSSGILWDSLGSKLKLVGFIGLCFGFSSFWELFGIFQDRVCVWFCPERSWDSARSYQISERCPWTWLTSSKPLIDISHSRSWFSKKILRSCNPAILQGCLRIWPWGISMIVGGHPPAGRFLNWLEGFRGLISKMLGPSGRFDDVALRCSGGYRQQTPDATKEAKVLTAPVHLENESWNSWRMNRNKSE